MGMASRRVSVSLAVAGVVIVTGVALSTTLIDLKHGDRPTAVPAFGTADAGHPPLTEAAAEPASAAATTAALAAAQPQEPATVQHAAAARLTRCTALIRQSVQFTLALPHAAALSTWAKEDADAHMFQSVLGLDYDSKLAPKAAAVLVATPEAAGCEATFVQIQPTTRACGDIEADLRRGGTALADLSGLTITPDDAPVKRMLLPGPGSGCVVVGVGLALNP